MCAARDDDWANEVRLCVLGAVADTHTAEARYHKDSMRRFFSNRMNPTGQENNPHISTSECRWWLLVDYCVLRNWDRILVRAVKGFISRAGMVSICPLLWQRDVKLQQTKSTSECQPDMALKHKIAMLSSDRKRIWNSVELFQEYQAHGGFNLTRSHLVDNLCRHFDWELLILSSPGYANIVAFWMSSITVTEDGERRRWRWRYRQQHP